MHTVHANIINSLAKVIESAQSGYAPKGLPRRMPLEAQSQNLTFTVLSAKNNQILLEEQVSGSKLLIDRNALQGNSSAQLVRGDSLILVSSNNKFATFVVEKNVAQNPNKLSGQALQNVSHSLSLQWPDIPANIIKKSQPLILNQLQLSVNTQQASTLANNIIAIASKTGQPTLTLNTTATATFIGNNQNALAVNKASAAGIRLNIDLNNRQAFALTIGFSGKLTQGVVNELKNSLTNNQTLLLDVDLNSKNQLLANIRPADQSASAAMALQISTLAMKEINAALSNQFQQIKQRLSPLLLSVQSPNLHLGIAIAPTERNLQDLGPAIKQQLTEGVSKQALQNTRILLGQSQQSNNRIQISLVDKPLTISILNSQLADAQIDDAGLSVSKGKKVNTDASMFIRSRTDILNENLAAKTKEGFISVGKVAEDVFQQNNRKLAASHEASNLNEQPSKALHNKLIEILRQQGNSESAIQAKVADLQSSIYREMNKVLPRAESMSKSLPAVLSQLQLIEKGAGPELKDVISQLSQQIKRFLPSAESLSGTIPSEFADTMDDIALSPESRQIKDALSTPTFPNINGAAVQAIIGVNSQSGLVNGLVAMLQASLQAKLMAQQPQLMSALLQSSQLTQLIPKMMGLSKSAGAQSKILQDLHKLDPRSNLIGELNKVLSNHSLHKLSGAESTLQNQDSFYYTLPNMFSPQHKDIEIVIKREQQAPQEKDQKVQQAWQLSMKLDIGDSGEVLAKVKLLNEHLDLNLYASNQLLKEKILDNLPHLNRRLVSLGLSVKPLCFLGKIPNTLHKTEYQVVQAYV